MTQEDKELLLQDLCARLPYGVKAFIKYTDESVKPQLITGISKEYVTLYDEECQYEEEFPFDSIQPYLRPMSSMTKKEKNELKKEHIKDEQLFTDCIKNHPERRGLVIPHFAADWCDKNMFAYRTIDGKDMFELGLALEAPKGMYNLDKK